MTVGFGSAPYAEMLPQAMSKYASVSLLAPEHFPGQFPDFEITRFRTGLSPAQSLRQSLKPWSHIDLLRKIRQTRPDVVHILNGYGYPWSLTAAAAIRVPIVTTLHDPTPHPGNRTDAIQSVLGRFTLRRSAAIHIHDRLYRPEIARRFPGKPVFVIRHPSFASRYLRHARPGATRGRSVLFFGRVEQYKGIETLLRAAAFLPPDVTLTIAGAGPLSGIEQALIREMDSRVRLLNRFIEDDEAAQLLQQAGVLAMPYLHATQSSLPLIAAAFGLPVVASAVGTFAEEVPALGGIAVPPGDPEALAGALLRQLSAPQPILNNQQTFDDLAPQFADMYRRVIAGCR
jgi:glycosyltransferase involved in cell wall biosynthesis